MSRLHALIGLLALFSFATSPAGFMPAANANGVALLICPGSTDIGNGRFAAPPTKDHGAMAMAGHHDHHAMAADAKPGTGPDADTSNPSCDYGTPVHAALPDGIKLSATSIGYFVGEAPSAHPLTTLFPAALPPSTGPPIKS